MQLSDYDTGNFFVSVINVDKVKRLRYDDFIKRKRWAVNGKEAL